MLIWLWYHWVSLLISVSRLQKVGEALHEVRPFSGYRYCGVVFIIDFSIYPSIR